MLTDFGNSFTGGLTGKFATKSNLAPCFLTHDVVIIFVV